MRLVVVVALLGGLAACGTQSATTLRPESTPSPTVSAVSLGEGPEEVQIPPEMRQLSSREMPLGATATKVATWPSNGGDRVIAMTVAGAFECRLDWLQTSSGDVKPLSNGCGRLDPAARWPRRERLEVDASGSGVGNGGRFSGVLPEGAELLRIEPNGLKPVYVRPFDAGEEWQHRRFFVVDVPYAKPTTISALDADGKVIDSYVENYV